MEVSNRSSFTMVDSSSKYGRTPSEYQAEVAESVLGSIPVRPGVRPNHWAMPVKKP